MKDFKAGVIDLGPPPLRHPEWFLRNVVDGKVMEKLGKKVESFYNNLFYEVVYRGHHNSFKVSFADVFYNDFVDYIVKACGFKKWFWRYLPEQSTLRYMYQRRKRFFRYLKKPREKRKHVMFGDIRWSLDFWLSQLSFWYATTKSLYNVWYRVVMEGKDIPKAIDWGEAITLYVISDFMYAARNSGYKAVRKAWVEKYKHYSQLEYKQLP